MKKSIKKYLIIALVIATLVVTSACVASAANEVKYYCTDCKAYVSPIVVMTYPATCTTEGYSSVRCNFGHMLENVRYNIKPAKGHDMGEGEYKLVGGTHYEKEFMCSRKNCGYKETDGVKYYKYDFVNCFGKVTAYDNTYAFAELPTEYEETVIATVYGKAGDVINGISAARPGDKEYGAYNFVGWVTDYTDENEKPEFDVTVEAAEADNVVYAKFVGDKTVQYSVNLYSDSGYLITTLKVNHGDGENGGILFRNASTDYTEWQKADDVNYRYKFAGWAWEKDKDLKVQNGDYFYGTPDGLGKINLVATYEATPKTYILNYYYEDDTKNAIDRDVVTNGMVGFDKMYPTKGLALSNSKVEDNPRLHGYSDRSYNYVFTGKWIILGQNGRILDLNELNLTGLLDEVQNPEGYKLVPQYEPVTRLYDLEVIVRYDVPAGQDYSKVLTITITDTEGYYIDSVTLMKPDDDGYYRYTAKLPYAERYNVSAVSESYTGYVYDRNNNPQVPSAGFDAKTETYSVVNIEMLLNEKEPCDCICHGFLQPVVIKIYNIINSLFKKKIVCCDDMYATIGHKLNYKY